MLNDAPKFPRMSFDRYEDVTNPGGTPKVKNVAAKALFRTFMQPALDTISWKARQFTPKQMAFNLLSASPLGNKILDFKGNYDYIKDPNAGGFSDNRFDGNGTNPSTNNANEGTSGLKIIVAAMQSTMAGMTDELRNIRRSVESLNRTTSSVNAEQAQTTGNTSELVSLYKAQMRGDKSHEKAERMGTETNESLLEGTPTSKSGILSMLMTLARGFIGKFKGFFTRGLALLGPAIALQFGKLMGMITGMFKGIKLPKMPRIPGLDRLGSSFAKIGAGLGKALGPLGGIIKGFGRIIGRFAIVTTVIMAVIDGVMGFFKGWGSTDGPIWKKLAGGLDGAMQGILKGLLEIPKMILQLLKGAATGILELLGFQKLAETLRDFNLGKWWDKTIGGMVDKFDPVKSMANLGEMLAKTFFDICAFVVKNLTGVSIPDIFNRDAPSARPSVAAGAAAPSAQHISGPAAPSAGLNPGQAAAGRARQQGANAVQAAGIQGLTPELINAVIHVESRGNTNAVSPKGARGRMQVMDATNRDPGYGVRPARDNSHAERERVGRDYLTALFRKYNGDIRKTLAAYNGGPGRVDSAIQRAGRQGGDWLSYMPAESRAYVPAVLRAVAPNQSQQPASPAARPIAPASTARVDANTAALRRSAANMAPPPVQPAVVTHAPMAVNHTINNQNNTITRARPPAADPGATPTGVRV